MKTIQKGKAVHQNAGLFWFVRNCIKEEVLASQFAHHSYKNSRRRRRRRGSLSGSSCWTSVLFAALWVELEQQAEGGEAEQQGLREPHAASGHAVDALVSGKEEWTHTYYTSTNKKYCVRQRPALTCLFYLFIICKINPVKFKVWKLQINPDSVSPCMCSHVENSCQVGMFRVYK